VAFSGLWAALLIAPQGGPGVGSAPLAAPESAPAGAPAGAPSAHALRFSASGGAGVTAAEDRPVASSTVPPVTEGLVLPQTVEPRSTEGPGVRQAALASERPDEPAEAAADDRPDATQTGPPAPRPWWKSLVAVVAVLAVGSVGMLYRPSRRGLA
jgi:hypothetical protein